MQQIISYIIAIVLVLPFVMGIGAINCHRTWADIAGITDVEYKAFAGCRIKTKTGWVPAKNYRFDDAK